MTLVGKKLTGENTQAIYWLQTKRGFFSQSYMLFLPGTVRRYMIFFFVKKKFPSTKKYSLILRNQTLGKSISSRNYIQGGTIIFYPQTSIARISLTKTSTKTIRLELRRNSLHTYIGKVSIFHGSSMEWYDACALHTLLFR